MAEQMTKALMNTLMGMGTVFAVLIVISLIISLFKYISVIERMFNSGTFRRKKRNRGVMIEEPPVPKRPVLRPEELEDEPDELINEPAGDELIAVLMAAILAAEGGAVSADSLRIRSVRRVKRRG